MKTDESVTQVAEFAVAKLSIGPGDVLVVRPSEKWTPEQRAYFARHLQDWSASQGLDFSVLVPPNDCELMVASRESVRES